MIKNTDNSKIPVDSARSPYSLFKSKVPLTYSTVALYVLVRIFRKPKPTSYPVRTQISIL